MSNYPWTTDDPTADARWNEGCDFAMTQLCKFLGVEPGSVNWDAATETVEGDVSAVIGNILCAKYGEEWGPESTFTPAQASGEPTEASIITGAMAIARSRGHDPDEPAPLTEMCTEDNAPVPWWKVFVEEAEACLKAVSSVSSTVPSPAALDQYEFPYQQTFEAIAAATEIYPSKEQALGLSISVKKFQEAFNNHRYRRPLKGVVVSSTDRAEGAA
jgi:hypothetical protein